MENATMDFDTVRTRRTHFPAGIIPGSNCDMDTATSPANSRMDTPSPTLDSRAGALERDIIAMNTTPIAVALSEIALEIGQPRLDTVKVSLDTTKIALDAMKPVLDSASATLDSMFHEFALPPHPTQRLSTLNPQLPRAPHFLPSCTICPSR